MPVATSLDKEEVREAYEDVRSNLTETEWAVFKFDSSQIVVDRKGQGFEEFKQQFADNERAFGYIRIQMGDEMSKRQKFLLITWIVSDLNFFIIIYTQTNLYLIPEGSDSGSHATCKDVN
jgi:hypothetical protein